MAKIYVGFVLLMCACFCLYAVIASYIDYKNHLKSRKGVNAMAKMKKGGKGNGKGGKSC